MMSSCTDDCQVQVDGGGDERFNKTAGDTGQKSISHLDQAMLQVWWRVKQIEARRQICMLIW